MDLKLLLGGALLTGVGVVAYVSLSRKETTPTTPTPAPAPINPSLPAPPVAQMPAAPASSDVVMACPQVVTECADGSWAPTPCDCQSRGGIAIDPEENQKLLAMKEEIKRSLGSLVLTKFANG